MLLEVGNRSAEKPAIEASAPARRPVALHPGEVSLPAFLALCANLGAMRLAAPPRPRERAGTNALVDPAIGGQEKAREHAKQKDRDTDQYPDRDATPEWSHDRYTIIDEPDGRQTLAPQLAGQTAARAETRVPLALYISSLFPARPARSPATRTRNTCRTVHRSSRAISLADIPARVIASTRSVSTERRKRGSTTR